MATNKSNSQEYDYIIVGGGSAGCVLAARLAESGEHSVALVEEGRSDVNPWIHIPATFFLALQSRDASTIVSEPDSSLGMKRFVVPQGRVLGGGSSVNGMLYMRGQAKDYDEWASIHGCEGWSYKDVLPTYIAQENNARLQNSYHGLRGPLVIGDPEYRHPLNKACIDAAIEAGIKPSDDFNGDTQEGAGWYQVTAKGGKRKSAAVCFLRPVEKQKNFHLVSETIATRIRFDGKRAVAVETVDKAGRSGELKCRKEIVLTAGSFQSPKLLMLSGIGPKDHLESFGIDVLVDAPSVGGNYQDHVGVPVTRKLAKPIGLHGSNKGLKALKHGIDYFIFRRGLLTSNLLEAGACVDTNGDGRPDVQFNFAPFAPGRPGEPPLELHGYHIHPMTMRPASRGRVFLKSADPLDPPRLEASALESEEDLDTLRRGVRLARKIYQQSPLKEFMGEEIWPGADIDTDTDNEAFDDAIRQQARTIYHPAGTCRMGGDAESVVDVRLKVRGVEGLRVADCSVMPALVSGNTNAPTMMIAGRAAEFILNENE
ncbi:GMC family oxidoreductase [Marinobacterium sp. YM272]|uniref:GMC family oxidoreductase n=1 Tax=Marinobacterium sp. YM272 TaxID=3421654 RepID=UPI003D7F2A0A